MEVLILTLLGALTAGVGLWAAMGEKKADPEDGEQEVRGDGAGPRSSPDLPPAGRPGAGPGDAGKPVVLGDREGLEDLKETLKQMPTPVEGKVVPGEEKQKPSTRRARQKPLQVTYSTDDIIARSSRHAYHRRALTNADALVEKQKAEEALAIFERVRSRVDDDEVRRKLDQNIEDIKRWLSGTDLEEEADSLQFPEIIVPLTTQAIALENLSEGLRNISEGIVQQLAQAFPALSGGGSPAGSPPSGAAPSAPSAPAAPASAPAPGRAGAAGGDPGAPSGESTVISGPVTATGSINATGQINIQGAPTGQAPGGSPGTGGGGTPGGAGTGTPAGGGGGPGGEGGAGGVQLTLPPGTKLTAAPQGTTMPAMGEIVSVSTGDALGLAEPGTETESDAPEGFRFDENGNLITEGWTDEDFDREWEKFKNLPLKDRRSGIERRSGQDRRRSFDPKRRDRRSGEDRRKKDLFKEREEFLKKLEKHKQRKKEYEDYLKNKDKKKEEEKQPELPLPRVPIQAQLAAPLVPEALKVQLSEREGPELPVLDLPKSHPLLEEGQDLPKLDLPKSEPLIEDEPEPEQEPEPEPEPEAEPEPEPQAKPAPPMEFAPPPDYDRPPAKLEMEQPDLSPVGMPGADDPFIPPDPMQADATEADDGAADGMPGGAPFSEGVEDAPEIPDLEPDEDEKKPPPQEIQGVLELRPPDEDDAPYLTLTYDFSKIPDSFKLSRDYHTMEYAYYKYKPMLIKAQQFTRRKMLKNALNYYRVIKSQNIPPEFKRMINRNIQDITEYLEKFLMRRSG